MPATDAELAQLKAFLRAMVQLVEAIEARGKVEQAAPADPRFPAPRALTRG